jgi:DNA-binding MarR family transcriptional regulator
MGDTILDKINRKRVQAFRKVLRRFERIHRILVEDRDCCRGLTIAQCHPLLEIDELGRTSLGDLASRLDLDPSTLSRTVENLVRQGLVQREPDSSDRRRVVLTLTAEGKRLVDDINAENDRFYDGILDRLPAERRDIAVQFFDELVRAIGDAVETCPECCREETV